MAQFTVTEALITGFDRKVYVVLDGTDPIFVSFSKAKASFSKANAAKRAEGLKELLPKV